MRGAIQQLPLYVFVAWYLLKHRDTFTLTLYVLKQDGETMKERYVEVLYSHTALTMVK
jgi:hypothetical protein